MVDGMRVIVLRHDNLLEWADLTGATLEVVEAKYKEVTARNKMLMLLVQDYKLPEQLSKE